MANSKVPVYPAPFIVEPLLQPHQQSFILLHGRGANGPAFGDELLSTPVSLTNFKSLVPGNRLAHVYDPITLRSIFPHARFIFPTAAPRKAVIYQKKVITQWFDNWHHSEIRKNTELMCDGLRDSTAFVRSLVTEEAAVVGSDSVVLGGLSQGCATVLTALLLSLGGEDSNEELNVAAVVGMCGWLPFAGEMAEVMEQAQTAHQLSLTTDTVIFKTDDPTMTDKTSKSNRSPHYQALEFLHDQLDSPAPNDPTRNDEIKPPPLFLGHGTDDDRVKIELGRTAAKMMNSFGIEVQKEEFVGLGHWYSPDMLAELVLFLWKTGFDKVQ
jgi:predicted esterase